MAKRSVFRMESEVLFMNGFLALEKEDVLTKDS